MKLQTALLISFCAVAPTISSAGPFDGWGMGDSWPWGNRYGPKSLKRNGNIWNNSYPWNMGGWQDVPWDMGSWQSGPWKSGSWTSGPWNMNSWKGRSWKDGPWSMNSWKNGPWDFDTWKNGPWSGRTKSKKVATHKKKKELAPGSKETQSSTTANPYSFNAGNQYSQFPPPPPLPEVVIKNQSMLATGLAKEPAGAGAK